MATSKITSPVEGFSGKVAGVSFTDGTGRTDDENAINYFSRHGYKVEAPKQSASSKDADSKTEKSEDKSGDGKVDDKSADSKTGDAAQGAQA